MLEDFRLKVFITLAQERSFTRAAEQLRVSQPAVSQNISELEKQVGTRLFDRLRGETVLTPAGDSFKEYAEEILSRYDEVFRLFQPFPDTIIRVAASDEVFSYLTENILGRFLAIHPEVRFEPAFLDDEADLKVTILPIKEKRGMLALSYHPSSELASTRLYRVLYGFLAPALV
jgi:DNA-binding transcriptional LysR family regulator